MACVSPIFNGRQRVAALIDGRQIAGESKVEVHRTIEPVMACGGPRRESVQCIGGPGTFHVFRGFMSKLAAHVSAGVGGAPTHEGRAPRRRNARASPPQGNRAAVRRGVRDSQGAHPRPTLARRATTSRSCVNEVVSRPPCVRNWWRSLAYATRDSERSIAAKQPPPWSLRSVLS